MNKYDDLLRQCLSSGSEQELREHLAQVLAPDQSDARKACLETLARDAVRLVTHGHLSSIENVMHIVSVSIDLGADPDEDDHVGATLLHRACSTGNLQIAKCLLAKGASVDAPASGLSFGGDTPLVAALEKLDHPMANFLLSQGASVDPPAAAKKSPLTAAIRSISPSMVSALLAAGANPLVADANGTTPIEVAMKSISSNPGNRLLKILSALVEAGVDPNVRGRQGVSVADFVLEHPEFEIALATSAATTQVEAMQSSAPSSSSSKPPRRI